MRGFIGILFYAKMYDADADDEEYVILAHTENCCFVGFFLHCAWSFKPLLNKLNMLCSV